MSVQTNNNINRANIRPSRYPTAFPLSPKAISKKTAGPTTNFAGFVARPSLPRINCQIIHTISRRSRGVSPQRKGPIAPKDARRICVPPSRRMTTFSAFNTGFSISNDANIIVIFPRRGPPSYTRPAEAAEAEADAVFLKNQQRHAGPRSYKRADCGISIRAYRNPQCIMTRLLSDWRASGFRRLRICRNYDFAVDDGGGAPVIRSDKEFVIWFIIWYRSENLKRAHQRPLLRDDI